MPIILPKCLSDYEAGILACDGSVPFWTRGGDRTLPCRFRKVCFRLYEVSMRRGAHVKPYVQGLTLSKLRNFLKLVSNPEMSFRKARSIVTATKKKPKKRRRKLYTLQYKAVVNRKWREIKSRRRSEVREVSRKFVLGLKERIGRTKFDARILSPTEGRMVVLKPGKYFVAWKGEELRLFRKSEDSDEKLNIGTKVPGSLKVFLWFEFIDPSLAMSIFDDQRKAKFNPAFSKSKVFVRLTKENWNELASLTFKLIRSGACGSMESKS